MLHSQAGADSRSRLYARDDVEVLKLRRDGRRDPAAVSREALSWGLPVLESAITLIRDGALYYRGVEIGTLAREWTFEQVAALLWLGDAARAGELFPVRPIELPAPWRRVVAGLRDRHPGERLQVVLRYAASEDPAAMDLRPERVAAWGARLLALMVATVSGRRHQEGEPLLDPLREAWMPGVEDASGSFTARSSCAPTTSSTCRRSPRAASPRPAPIPTRRWRQRSARCAASATAATPIASRTCSPSSACTA